MIDRERAVERIRKLLNHAKGPGERISETEVEVYLKHARKLMDEFNIDEQEAMQSDKGQQDAYASIREEKVYGRAGRLDEFMIRLAHVIKHICDVGFFLQKDVDEKWKVKHPNDNGVRYGRRKLKFVGLRQWVVFYGLPQDLAVGAELYKELLTAMRIMCRVRYGEARPPEYKAYCLGFADRLINRAIEAKKVSTNEAGTTAIVLVKDGLVKRWAENNLNLRGRKTRGSTIGEGYGEGYDDGANVSLDTNQITSPGRHMVD